MQDPKEDPGPSYEILTHISIQEEGIQIVTVIFTVCQVDLCDDYDPDTVKRYYHELIQPNLKTLEQVRLNDLSDLPNMANVDDRSIFRRM